MIKHYNIICRY